MIVANSTSWSLARRNRSMWRNPSIRIASIPGITSVLTTDSYASAFCGVVHPRQIRQIMVSSDLLLVFSYRLGHWHTWGKLLSDMTRQKNRATRGRSIHRVSRIGSPSPPACALNPGSLLTYCIAAISAWGPETPVSIAPNLGKTYCGLIFTVRITPPHTPSAASINCANSSFSALLKADLASNVIFSTRDEFQFGVALAGAESKWRAGAAAP